MTTETIIFNIVMALSTIIGTVSGVKVHIQHLLKDVDEMKNANERLGERVRQLELRK